MSTRIFPYSIPLTLRTELNNAAPIGDAGINGRRAMAGFALGLAIGAALPIVPMSQSIAQTTFATQFKWVVEDAVAQINEFLIVDRQLAVDVARGYFLYRTAMAGDMVDDFFLMVGQDPFPLLEFIVEKDFAFYQANRATIIPLFEKILVLVRLQRAEDMKALQAAD